MSDTQVPQLGTSAAQFAPSGNHPLNNQGEVEEFRFTDLPGEIKNKIYRELLVNENLDNLELPSFGRCDIHPAILQTCREIYEDGSSILYGENRFLATVESQKLYTTILDRPITLKSNARIDPQLSPTHRLVKHWTIFHMANNVAFTHDGRNTMAMFARFLKKVPAGTLESIRIGMPKCENPEMAINPTFGFTDDAYQGVFGIEPIDTPNLLAYQQGKYVDTTFVPLNMLRGLQKVEFTGMGANEVRPDALDFVRRLTSQYPAMDLDRRFKLALRCALEFERSFEMRHVMDPRQWFGAPTNLLPPVIDPAVFPFTGIQGHMVRDGATLESRLMICFEYSRCYSVKFFEEHFAFLVDDMSQHVYEIKVALNNCKNGQMDFFHDDPETPGNKIFDFTAKNLGEILNELSNFARVYEGKTPPNRGEIICSTVFHRLEHVAEVFRRYIPPPCEQMIHHQLFLYRKEVREAGMTQMHRYLFQQHWAAFAKSCAMVLKDMEEQLDRLEKANSWLTVGEIDCKKSEAAAERAWREEKNAEIEARTKQHLINASRDPEYRWFPEVSKDDAELDD